MEPFIDGRSAQSLLFTFYNLELKPGFISLLSLLFIILTAAEIRGVVVGVCQVSVILTANWSWIGNALYFMATLQRGQCKRRDRATVFFARNNHKKNLCFSGRTA